MSDRSNRPKDVSIVLRLFPHFAVSSRHLLATVAITAVLGLTACAPEPKLDDYKEEPISTLYDRALEKMEAGEYTGAARAFEDVEQQHPYSTWAVKAQIMAAYAYYKDEEYDDAIIAAERFIDLYPANKDVHYAYYIRAMCYYEQISTVSRDQKMTLLAKQSLEEIVKRFPDSEYARDARLKIDLTIDHLAGKELDIGRFYQSKGDWLAAINRFQKVVKDFQTTTHAPEALYRLVEVYTQIGLDDQAAKSAAVLGHNYPGSEWYEMAYAILKPEYAEKMPKSADGSWTDYVWPF